MITIYTHINQGPDARAQFVRLIQGFLRGNPVVNGRLTDRQVAYRLARQWHAEGLYDGRMTDLVPLVAEVRS